MWLTWDNLKTGSSHATQSYPRLTLRKIAIWISKNCQKLDIFFKKIAKNFHFFLKKLTLEIMSSFWQFFDSQMAIFRRVRLILTEILYKQTGLIQLRNRLAHFLSKQVVRVSDEGGKVSHRVGELPRPINNERACSKCEHLLTCSAYQRSVLSSVVIEQN